MISVIVPVYNVAPFLSICLNSLANQTFTDIEFIIVNDGSTDGSAEICEEFIKNKSNYKMINKPNGGLMSAWMEGLNYINGDYIGFVDSDDYIDNKMFEIMYREAKNKNADIVMCDRFDVFNDFRSITRSPIGSGEYSDDKLKIVRSLIFPRINEHHISNSRCNKIYRKEVILNNTIYCKDLSRFFEDRYIVPACMFSIRRLVYLDVPLYYYRHRENSNHSRPSMHLYDNLKRLYRNQRTMLFDKGLIEEYSMHLEQANIDYIRLIINRNMGLGSSFNSKYETLKQILNDKDYKLAVSKYKNNLTTKLGLFIRFAFAIKSPFVALMVYNFFYFSLKLTKVILSKKTI